MRLELSLASFAGIPRNMTVIAEKLKEAGYQTHLVGREGKCRLERSVTSHLFRFPFSSHVLCCRSGSGMPEWRFEACPLLQIAATIRASITSTTLSVVESLGGWQ